MLKLVGVIVALVVVAAMPLAAGAQPASIPRVGVLTPEPFMVQVRDGLRELGYIEGQNIALDWRWAHGDPKNHPALAAELVRLRVNVIVAGSNSAIQAAQHATRTQQDRQVAQAPDRRAEHPALSRSCPRPRSVGVRAS